MLKSMTWLEFRSLVTETELPDDLLVVFSADYGDHGHTQQALPIKGEFELHEIGESGYSRSGYEVKPRAEESTKVQEDDDSEGTGRCDRCLQQVGAEHRAVCPYYTARLDHDGAPTIVLVIS